MLNLQDMMQVRLHDFEVTMNRNRSLNAEQNARKRVEYVRAIDEKQAKAIANKRRPEFKAMSARRI